MTGFLNQLIAVSSLKKKFTSFVCRLKLYISNTTTIINSSKLNFEQVNATNYFTLVDMISVVSHDSFHLISDKFLEVKTWINLSSLI